MPHGRVRARDLLTRAAERYDAPGSPLCAAAAGAAFGGFASGAQWMRLALETLRGRPCPPTAFNYQLLGLIKYGLAAGVALLVGRSRLRLARPVARAAGGRRLLCRRGSDGLPLPPGSGRQRPALRRRPALDAPRWRDRRCDAGGYAAGLHHALRRPGRPRLSAKLVPRLPGRLPLVRGPPQRAAVDRRVLVPPRMGRLRSAARPA